MAKGVGFVQAWDLLAREKDMGYTVEVRSWWVFCAVGVIMVDVDRGRNLCHSTLFLGALLCEDGVPGVCRCVPVFPLGERCVDVKNRGEVSGLVSIRFDCSH